MSKNVLSAAGIGDRNVLLETEFERVMRLTSWLRECLEKEMAGALGTREQFCVDDKTLRKWKDLVACLNSLAETKIRLEKHAKDRSRGGLTPEQELATVRAYVRALPPEARGGFLVAEAAFHRSSTP